MQISPLAVRMKSYESATGSAIPAKTWSVIRLDGKAFHSYTKNLRKPFDYRLLADMDDTMKYLCENIEGAVFGYTQSDEISILFGGPSERDTQLWFGGKVQKIVSVSAGLASAKFNSYRAQISSELAVFDSRVFSLPSEAEVRNYLRWRQQDSIKNSVFMAASRLFSHKQLIGKTVGEKISILEDTEFPWSSYVPRVKVGAQCYKVYTKAIVSYTRRDTGEKEQTEAVRASWDVRPADDFFDKSQALEVALLGDRVDEKASSRN
jgi:tRNA(His) guanylyltransferase